MTQTALIHEVGGTEVQGRNTILIGLGAAYAQTLGATALFIGLQSQDVVYGDAQPEYFDNIRKAIEIAYGVVLMAPLLDKGKVEIINLARELNIDLDQTYSCYFSSTIPCGTCPSCRVRNAAEKASKEGKRVFSSGLKKG